jgi:hypothetical protein
MVRVQPAFNGPSAFKQVRGSNVQTFNSASQCAESSVMQSPASGDLHNLAALGERFFTKTLDFFQGVVTAAILAILPAVAFIGLKNRK